MSKGNLNPFILNFTGVRGELVRRPPNTTITVFVDQIIQLECFTDQPRPVNWLFKSVTSSSADSIPIYEGGTVAFDVVDRMTVKTKVIGEYTLVIYDTTVADSGTFTCVDNAGFGPEKAETELLVVGELTFYRYFIEILKVYGL